jgi:hypothetical protein
LGKINLFCEGSLALNSHFDPDDSRAQYQSELTPAEAIIEDVITRTCYGGEEYKRPHIPAKFTKLLQAKQANRDRDKAEDSNKE